MNTRAMNSKRGRDAAVNDDKDGYLSRNMTIRTNLNDDSQVHDERIITV